MNKLASSSDAADHRPAKKQRRRRKPRSRANSSELAAVIDLGTNNCRLLIAQRRSSQRNPSKGSSFRVVDSFSRIVRLGEGLGQSGELSPAAIDRTVEALKICASKIAKSGAGEVRAVATQACREARNGSDFLARVLAETGIHLRTITPLQEVELGVSSTLPLLKNRWPYALIFDVGGGSTEVSFLHRQGNEGFELVDSISVPTGVVSLAECRDDPDSDLCAQTYARMVADVRGAFQDFADRNHIPALQDQGLIQTVGMSGTVTTVKALDLGLKTYRRDKVDRTLFNMARFGAIRDTYLSGGAAALAANGCIGRNRADLVLPGMAILEGLGQAFSFSRLLVLDRGLREGLLHEIFQSKSARGAHPMRGKEACNTARAA